jgi:hypothetical protein
MSKFLSLISSSLILLTGCATIMHGTSENVAISSNPTNASVSVDGRYIGRSPTIVNLTRKNNHTVKIELEGYEPYETILTHQVSGWTFGNIIFGAGGLVGLAVDAISGGLYRLSAEQVTAEMRKLNPVAALPKTDGICIAFIQNPDPSWEKVDNLTASP